MHQEITGLGIFWIQAFSLFRFEYNDMGKRPLYRKRRKKDKVLTLVVGDQTQLDSHDTQRLNYILT